MITVIGCIFEVIGIIVFLLVLTMAISKLVTKVLHGDLFHHQYQLDSIISVEKNGEKYDSTFYFVCRKCGKKRIVNTKGYNTFCKHCKEREENE